MSYQSLIGKPAPPITLKNYDGQDYTFTPGATGLPTALFFYPQSGTFYEPQFEVYAIFDVKHRLNGVYTAGMPVPRRYSWLVQPTPQATMYSDILIRERCL